MKKIVPNGAEVLIFKYVKEYGFEQDEENFIRGIVQSSESSPDLANHGNPWYKEIYEVLGEDGKTYHGAYGFGIIGDSFFRTVEDHIEIINHKISLNNKQIKKMENENTKYLETINNLENTKDKTFQKKMTI